ncbi:hypothetical protein RAC69_03945 [Microbacterium sp. LS_15]|uniref:hypothetical protein n=1 Tax=Microbacterium sp. LS_15 TaxID=3055790 RepID=UPI0035C1F6F6
MTRGRRRGVILAVLSGALLVVIVAIVLACTPMSRAAPGAVAHVEDVVGDSGEVSVSVTEQNINVTPSCIVRVQMNDDVAEDELARVLEDVWAAPGDSPCVVQSVDTASRSTIFGAPPVAMTADTAAAVAAALQRFDSVSLSVNDGGNLFAFGSAREGDFSDAAELVRAGVASAALEEQFGRVDWMLTWSGEGRPYDDAEVTSDATPDPRLAELFDGLADLRASGALGSGPGPDSAELDAPITGMTVKAVTEAGATSVSVAMTVAGWDAENLVARGGEFALSSRAAEAARMIAELGEEIGMPVGSIVANDTVELVPGS